jgi:phage terminase large subunit-like protein
MTSSDAESHPSPVKPGYQGLLELAERVGLPVQPYQRRILRLLHAGVREALILLPRGQGKTTLMAVACVHHLLTVEDAKVYVAASARGLTCRARTTLGPMPHQQPGQR